jgi:hypothetical protein
MPEMRPALVSVYVVCERTSAYTDGLRNGQSWVVVVVAHLPTVSAELDVREGDHRRSIKYYPAATKTVWLPRYSLKPGATVSEQEALLQRLGVGRD